MKLTAEKLATMRSLEELQRRCHELHEEVWVTRGAGMRSPFWDPESPALADAAIKKALHQVDLLESIVRCIRYRVDPSGIGERAFLDAIDAQERSQAKSPQRGAAKRRSRHRAQP